MSGGVSVHEYSSDGGGCRFYDTNLDGSVNNGYHAEATWGVDLDGDGIIDDAANIESVSEIICGVDVNHDGDKLDEGITQILEADWWDKNNDGDKDDAILEAPFYEKTFPFDCNGDSKFTASIYDASMFYQDNFKSVTQSENGYVIMKNTYSGTETHSLPIYPEYSYATLGRTPHSVTQTQTFLRFSDGDREAFWRFPNNINPFGEIARGLSFCVPSQFEGKETVLAGDGLVFFLRDAAANSFLRLKPDMTLQYKSGDVLQAGSDKPVKLQKDTWYTVTHRDARKASGTISNSSIPDYVWERITVKNDVTGEFVCDISGDRCYGHVEYDGGNIDSRYAQDPTYIIANEYGFGLELLSAKTTQETWNAAVYVKNFHLYRPAVSTTLGENAFDIHCVDANNVKTAKAIQGSRIRRPCISEFAGQTVSVDMIHMYALDIKDYTYHVIYALALHDDEGALIAMDCNKGVITNSGLKAADGVSVADVATLKIPTDAGRHYQLKRYLLDADTLQPLMLPEILA